jgi:hypothetical protein
MTDRVTEARLLRTRLAALEARADALGERGDSGARRMVARVFNAGAIPATTGKFFACHPVAVTGDEAEGATPSLTVDTSQVIYVDVLGTRVPAVGDDLACRRVAHRWVAFGGAAAASCGSLCVGTAENCPTLAPLDGVAVTVTSRTVTSLAVAAGGSGYASPPAVGFGTTLGRGAAATATLTGGVVTGLVVTSGGFYTGTPAVTLSGGGGSGASATPAMGTATIGAGTSTGQVTAIALTANGTGYTSAPTVGLAGGGGSGAAATATLAVLSFSVGAAGSGYTATPAVALAGGGGSGASGRALLTATAVASLTLAAAGSNYTGVPALLLVNNAGQAGSGAAGSARMRATTAAVSAGGTGYAAGDVLTVSGGTSTAAASLTVTAVNATTGAVLTAAVTAGGVYSAVPASPASATGGPGTGATFALHYAVDSLVLTAAGAGYSGDPSVIFSGGGGTGASGSSVLVATTLASVALVAAGSGYTGVPTASLTGGGGGSGASATATMKVAAVAVADGGSGYTSAPAVTFPGGGGSGAAATATIRHQACVPLTAAGGYLYSGSKAGYATSTGSAVLSACSGTPALQLTPSRAAFTVTAIGCHGLGLPGATITISGGTGGPWTFGPTDASGVATGPSPAIASGVSYTVTASHPRYSDTPSSTLTLANCGSSVALSFATPGSSYACGKDTCAYPYARTLTLSDPSFGAITLTWAASGAHGVGWYGTTTASSPACVGGGCAAASGVKVDYFWDGGSGPGDNLLISYSASGSCPCASGSPGCTDGAGNQNVVASSFALTCPPAFLLTGHNLGSVNGIYCTDATFSLVE